MTDKNGAVTPTSDSNGIHGANVTSSDFNNEDWWNDSGTGLWESVWGDTDTEPWQWGENDLPVLYWE